ncbi:MAG: Fic family protein [Gammaproteobacteria bacterium]
MPKRVSDQELQSVEDLLLRRPAGLSASELRMAFDPPISASTLKRRLGQLEKAGRIRRHGVGRATRYFHAASAIALRPAATSREPGRFETPGGIVAIPLSVNARDQLEYVSRPLAARRPCGYERRMLDDYIPNRTEYVPADMKVRLHRMGRPIPAERIAGTFARDILNRFLIDLSWASSSLEGNTYTRLDTERLIQFGEQASGKDARETQMILNHKAAIEWLVEGGSDVGINRHTLLNLHALLSENLMADPEASGRLRERPVEIGGTAYTPNAIPQVVDEVFHEIFEKASAIGDPFEQAFFLMVHLPYLQPFEDVNKRVSRLAANIPLIRGNFCPLSFIDVPERAYVAGYLSVYELTRFELLLDVFAWAYERSCQRYVVIRDSVVEPDLFKLKYRNALIEVIGNIISARRRPSEPEVREMAVKKVKPRDLPHFATLVLQELGRLNAGNIARYKIRLAEYYDWTNATKQ